MGVEGEMNVGSESKPFTSNLNVILTGTSSDQLDDAVQKEMVGHGAGSLPYSKVFMGGHDSTIKIHGVKKTSWIKLAQTAEGGSTTLVLSERPDGWSAGDKIVVPST